MTRPDLTSEQQATSGPNPASIQRSEGPISRESLDALLLLPHQFRDAAAEIRDLKNALLAAFAPQLYANALAVSDASGTQLGTTATAFLQVFPPATHGALTVLRNIMVGSDTAGKVQIYVSAHDALYSDIKGKLLGSVRLTTQTPSAWFAGELLLQPDERVFLYHLGGSAVKLDFSCDYRLLRGR